MSSKTVKEPFVRISKRADVPLATSILVRVAALVLGFIVCSLVITMITNGNANFFSVLPEMIKGAFGTARKFKITLREMSALLCIALALAPAFKMKFWNIGGEGQTLMGVLASVTVIKMFPETSNGKVLILMFIASAAAGAIWAVIPAIFKANFKTNETLFTLMMNYVAIQLMSYFLVLWERQPGTQDVGVFENGVFPMLFGVEYGWNIVLVLILAVFMYIYLKYSKHGYELSVVGESENTARYIGLNVKKVIIRTMLLSGAICGFAGFLLVGGTHHTMNTSLVDGNGFTAIIVAWLAKLNPFYMIVTSLLVVFLGNGTDQIASSYNLNDYASDVVIGIMLFFVLGCEFFVNYKVTFRKKHESKEAQA